MPLNKKQIEQVSKSVDRSYISYFTTDKRIEDISPYKSKAFHDEFVRQAKEIRDRRKSKEEERQSHRDMVWKEVEYTLEDCISELNDAFGHEQVTALKRLVEQILDKHIL